MNRLEKSKESIFDEKWNEISKFSETGGEKDPYPPSASEHSSEISEPGPGWL